LLVCKNPPQSPFLKGGVEFSNGLFGLKTRHIQIYPMLPAIYARLAALEMGELPFYGEWKNGIAGRPSCFSAK